MRVDILALDGVFDTGLAAFQDTLATAGELAPPEIDVRFDVRVVGCRRTVRTAQGLRVTCAIADPADPPDYLLVPALGAKTDDTLGAALAGPGTAAVGRLLRRRREQDVTIAAACTGVFVLAEAGLLDRVEATTTWWLAPFFRSRYPGIALNDTRTLVQSGTIVTAGAVLAHFDLALWIVRRSSPALADTIARYLMLDPRTPQSSYAIPDHVRHSDPVVQAFERWVRENMALGLSVEEAAGRIGVSGKTLARRVRETLGRTPMAYYQDLRIERATHLLGTTRLSVDEIATQTGYMNGTTLRSLIRNRTGRTASELRRINEHSAS